MNSNASYESRDITPPRLVRSSIEYSKWAESLPDFFSWRSFDAVISWEILTRLERTGFIYSYFELVGTIITRGTYPLIIPGMEPTLGLMCVATAVPGIGTVFSTIGLISEIGRFWMYKIDGLNMSCTSRRHCVNSVIRSIRYGILAVDLSRNGESKILFIVACTLLVISALESLIFLFINLYHNRSGQTNTIKVRRVILDTQNMICGPLHFEVNEGSKYWFNMTVKDYLNIVVTYYDDLALQDLSVTPLLSQSENNVDEILTRFEARTVIQIQSEFEMQIFALMQEEIRAQSSFESSHESSAITSTELPKIQEKIQKKIWNDFKLQIQEQIRWLTWVKNRYEFRRKSDQYLCANLSQTWAQWQVQMKAQNFARQQMQMQMQMWKQTWEQIKEEIKKDILLEFKCESYANIDPNRAQIRAKNWEQLLEQLLEQIQQQILLEYGSEPGSNLGLNPGHIPVANFSTISEKIPPHTVSKFLEKIREQIRREVRMQFWLKYYRNSGTNSETKSIENPVEVLEQIQKRIQRRLEPQIQTQNQALLWHGLRRESGAHIDAYREQDWVRFQMKTWRELHDKIVHEFEYECCENPSQTQVQTWPQFLKQKFEQIMPEFIRRMHVDSNVDISERVIQANTQLCDEIQTEIWEEIREEIPEEILKEIQKEIDEKNPEEIPGKIWDRINKEILTKLKREFGENPAQTQVHNGTQFWKQICEQILPILNNRYHAHYEVIIVEIRKQKWVRLCNAIERNCREALG